MPPPSVFRAASTLLSIYARFDRQRRPRQSMPTLAVVQANASQREPAHHTMAESCVG
jgi:hypothetical protein